LRAEAITGTDARVCQTVHGAAAAAHVLNGTDHLERFLRLGRPIEAFAHKNYRQVWIKPCWLCYRVQGDSVYILHVRRAEKPVRIQDLLIDD
jgi:hypothetical protein